VTESWGARVNWSRVLVYGLLPALVLLLAIAAGLLKWKDSSVRTMNFARSQSVAAARDSTVALLSFRFDTVDRDVAAARQRLTGDFLDSYTKQTQGALIRDAKQRHVTAMATVPGAAAESVMHNHAVVLVFVNQAIQIGESAPVDADSSVRVTLDKIGDRWLVSGFDQF
jgi:Mce-associated membrane protein